MGCKINSDGSQGSSPVIGNNVDFGSNSVIVGPIEINNCVAKGVGSVIAKSILPNAIVVGNPGKIIGY